MDKFIHYTHIFIMGGIVFTGAGLHACTKVYLYQSLLEGLTFGHSEPVHMNLCTIVSVLILCVDVMQCYRAPYPLYKSPVLLLLVSLSPFFPAGP